LGIASWQARNDVRTPAQLGLLRGILAYDAAAAVLLALGATVWNLPGSLIWLGVALHAGLAVWCLSIVCSQAKP